MSFWVTCRCLSSRDLLELGHYLLISIGSRVKYTTVIMTYGWLYGGRVVVRVASYNKPASCYRAFFISRQCVVLQEGVADNKIKCPGFSATPYTVRHLYRLGQNTRTVRTE